MITTVLSICLFIIFALLSLLHVYWMFGGNWALKPAMPTKNDVDKVTIPGIIPTLIVSIGLALFGLHYLLKSDLVHLDLPNWIISFAGWMIPSLFTLRAIGEFNYVGFFKKIKHTTFAKADTKIFSPLCLGIGIVGLIIQLL